MWSCRRHDHAHRTAMAGAPAVLRGPPVKHTARSHGLAFNGPNRSTQARAAFVYGAGADINMSKHLFMRAEYSGLVYNSPTFGIPRLAASDRVTHEAEPTVGFGFRF